MVITEVDRLPGLRELWAETLGNPAITIALLDGPVDLGHPCFEGALLASLPTLVSGVAGNGRMSAHATHIASMIFGQHGGAVPGIAPWCRGLIVPIYSDSDQRRTSQMDLARAINQAVDAGAQVLNISGGELSNNGEADPMLVNAVRNCYEQGALIVAAAGNDSCRCLHVPAALPTVLAVGASDSDGLPLESSNWGDAYQAQGVLAPGINMVGAAPGGGVALRTGSSFATPVVTGVVGLLLSLQRKRGTKPAPHAVREAILATAIPCEGGPFADCLRFLVGRLNIPGAHALISQTQMRRTMMPDERISGDRVQPSDPVQPSSASSSGLVAQEDHGTPLGVFQPPGGGDGSGSQVSHAQPSEPGIIAAAARTPETSGASQSVAASPRTPGGGAATAAARTPDTTGASQPVAASPRTPGGGAATAAVRPNGVVASDDCTCKSTCTSHFFLDPVNVGTKPPIFAIGVLGYDFGTEARRDTFKALMPSVDPNGGFPFQFREEGGKEVIPFPANPYEPRQMANYLAGYPRPRPPFPSQGGFQKLSQTFPNEIPNPPPGFPFFKAGPWMAKDRYPGFDDDVEAKEGYPGRHGYSGFEAHPWDAAELIWTLNIELTPIYAIRPAGGFSAEVYQRLVEFLDGQTRDHDSNEFVERVSIPGYLSGESVCLFSGQVVPVLVPNLRGMFGWNTTLIVEMSERSVKQKFEKLKLDTPEKARAQGLPPLEESLANIRGNFRNFLDRIYFDLRNLGQTPAERALNFSATNAFQAAEIIGGRTAEGLQLDRITTERSAFCRKDSDCWDVKLKFFDPNNVLRARQVSRFTVDVSDVMPVQIGPIRTWSESYPG